MKTLDLRPLGLIHCRNEVRVSPFAAWSRLRETLTHHSPRIDPLQLTHASNVGTAKNFSTSFSIRADGLTRAHQSGYRLKLLIKDLKIAEGVFASEGIPSTLPAYLREECEGGLGTTPGGMGACHTELLEVWEEKYGVQVKQYDEVGGDQGV